MIVIFILYILIGFLGMEFISYLIHRFVFHGPLWRIHQTHHKPGRHKFELNDLFSLFFALVSIYLILSGVDNPINNPYLGLGIGMAVYGISYFIIHDVIIHKRFIPVRTHQPWLLKIKKEHQRHHQSIQKRGREPFGLFFYFHSFIHDKESNS